MFSAPLQKTVRQIDTFFETLYAEAKPSAWLQTTLRLAARLGLVLFIFVCLDRVLFHFLHLPEASYFQPVILLAAVRHVGFIGVALALMGGLWLSLSFQLWRPWSEIQEGQLLRPLLTFIALLLAWWFATYNYNLYFDQGHYLDRLALVVTAVLIFWRPAFTLPFLAVLIPISSQFNYPLGGFSLAQPLLPLHIVMLFAAWLLFSNVSRRQNAADFIFLALCLIAASYLAPGLGKLKLNWATHGHLFFLVFATYANGWLAFLRPEQLLPIARIGARIDPLMVGFTLLAEVGSILFLWRRATAVAWLAGWILLHIGIFSMSGIFFWTWILVDAAFLLLIWYGRYRSALQFFTLPHFLLSLLIIGSGVFLFRPVTLAWYDSPVSYTYRLQGIGDSGAVYDLSPSFFAPYDYQFTLSDFSYLIDSPHLRIVWGSIMNRPALNALMGASTAVDVWTVETDYGLDTFDAARAEAFDQFVQTFVSHANQRHSQSPLLNRLQPPDQLWTFPRQNEYRYQEPLREVCVSQLTSFFDGSRYAEIRRRPVRQIDVQPAAANTPFACPTTFAGQLSGS